METIRTLAIETSCDETSVAILENGRKVLSNVVVSQISIHETFGGVCTRSGQSEACGDDESRDSAGFKGSEFDPC